MSARVTTTRSMAYDLVSGVVLAIHPNCAPCESDWEGFIAWLRGFDMSRRRLCLTFNEGPGPNPQQRRMLMEVPGAHDTQTVILTRSLLARGAITALNWLGYSKLVSRDYADIEGGFDYLGVERDRRSVLIRRSVELKCELLGYSPLEVIQGCDTVTLVGMTLESIHQHIQRAGTRGR